MVLMVPQHFHIERVLLEGQHKPVPCSKLDQSVVELHSSV